MNVAPTRAVDLRNFALRRRASATAAPTRRRTERSCRRCRSGSPGTSRTTRSSSRRSTGKTARRLGDPERGRLRADLQRDLQRRARDAGARASASPAAERRRAATTTRRARGRRSRRSRSSGPAKLAGLKTFDAWAHHPYYAGPSRHADDQAGHRQGRTGDRGHARQHRRPDRGRDAALRQQAHLDHRVRLPDEPARPDLRRLVGEAGGLSDAGVRDRAEEPADRHDALVPAQGRAEPRRLAVGPDHATAA